MSEKVIITKSKITNLADKVRAKVGTSINYTIDAMAAAVENLQLGVDENSLYEELNSMKYGTIKPTIFTIKLDGSYMQPAVRISGFLGIFSIDWGDGETQTITISNIIGGTYVKPTAYSATGLYTVKVLVEEYSNKTQDAYLYISVSASKIYGGIVETCEYQKDVYGVIPSSSFGSIYLSSNTPLIKITIPEGIIKIGSHAFAQCTLLNTLIIPSSVVSIEERALQTIGSSSNKSTITFKGETPPTISTYMFNTSALQEIRVPASAVDAYKSATNWSAYADYIVGY